MMIRNPNKNHREFSNSHDKNTLKKSTSSNSTKNKPSTNSNNTSMTNSIKYGTRIDSAQSKSNKKMQTSNSNKSLKETVSSLNTLNASKKVSKDNNTAKQQKKGAILVKNIKNKIVGNNSTVINKSIKGKENSNQFGKKTSVKIDNVPFVDIQSCNTNTKTPRTPRDHLRSDVKLTRRDSVKVQENIKLSMSMFEVGRKLGRGRFGDVYMAREKNTGFALAMKVINKKQLKESEMQSQLIQQIKIQMYSNHPNILKMYGFFDDDKKIYLLLELATNGCLFRQIRQKNYFTEELACFYFRQITSGIRYLHSNCVIHRDIKPENILNCFGVLKICDFGWAIYSPIYQRQTFCGTLDYVPPEIVTGQFYDEKADVWCLGVLCYQLCTGKAPFQSKTDENETYDKILKVSIDFPLHLSGNVVDFISKILNRDPQKRIDLGQVQSHEWMRLHENETGRMISKQIWDNWMRVSK